MSLKQRLGFDFPDIDKQNKPLIWIHAVSVGETRAVISLAKSLKERYTLIISSVTETGHAEAKRSLSFADYHLFLPLDLKFIINPIIKKVKPDFCIISETDLWFEFLKSLKENGAKIVLVNGKISSKSFKRLQFFKFFANRLYLLIDFFMLQNDLYKERFSTLGVPENKISITGNLKFDEEYALLDDEELIVWKKRLSIKDETKVLVIGSTHDPEEALILNSLNEIMVRYPNLKIIIVPRHPERFDTVEKELISRKLQFNRFSQTAECQANIILIDAMGLLRNCYQVADVAIVAGSFTEKIGGHNILEPLGYGVPLIFGPFMHSQPDLLSLVLEYHAGIQTTENELSRVINLLLSDSDKRLCLKNAGLKLISDVRGSSKRTLNVCERLFH